MIFNFLFHLSIIFDIVTSGSLRPIKKDEKHVSSVSQGKGTLVPDDNEPFISKESLDETKLLENDENKRDYSKNMEPLLDLNTLVDEKLEANLDSNHSIDLPEKSTKASESLIPKDVESNPLLGGISEALSFVPLDLVRIVDDYINPDKTIYECFNRITKILKEIIKETITFNLYTLTFISDLFKLINDNQKKITNNPFWYDLARFLFKYALGMRMIFANDDASFEESVKNIRDIVIIIQKNAMFCLIAPKLQSTTGFSFKIFYRLLQYEIFDHPELLKLFIDNIIDKEANLIMTIDQIEEIYCDGSIDNNNPFLKMMLIEFAFGSLANDQMIERGWITDKDKDKDYHGYCNFAIALFHIYLKDGDCEDEIDMIEHMWPSYYINQSTIKFFIANNLGFRMFDSELVDFLKRLEYIEGLPKGISIDKIIKFRDGNVFKWNKAIFIDYLMREKERYDPSKQIGISPGEYQKFIKLLPIE